MLIIEVLGGLSYFFVVIYSMLYVFSEFVWIGANKTDSIWVIPGDPGGAGGLIPLHTPV